MITPSNSTPSNSFHFLLHVMWANQVENLKVSFILFHFHTFLSFRRHASMEWVDERGNRIHLLENSLSFHCYSFAARWTSSARFVRGKIVSNSPSLSSHNSHPCEAKAQINGTHIRTSELIVNNKNSMISILAARKHSKA